VLRVFSGLVFSFILAVSSRSATPEINPPCWRKAKVRLKARQCLKNLTRNQEALYLRLNLLTLRIFLRPKRVDGLNFI